MYDEIEKMAKNVLEVINSLDVGEVNLSRGKFNSVVSVVSSLKKALPELIIDAKNSWSEISMVKKDEVLLLVIDLGLLPQFFPSNEAISKASYELLCEIKQVEDDNRDED